MTLDAWWQPTDHQTISQMLDMLDITNGDLVYDLGCGDGRFLTRIAKDFDAQAVGVEIDPVRVLVSWLRIIFSGTFSQAKVVMGDMYEKDLTDADAVLLFLSKKANKKLSPKLENELKTGTKVVSFYHKVPGWDADRVERNNEGHKIYLYVR